MSLNITTTGGAAISIPKMTPGETYPFRITNTNAYGVRFILFLAANDGKDPSLVSNVEGNEIVTEGWVSVRPLSGGAWTQIGDPGTFPGTFDDLSTGCYSSTLPAGASVDMEAKIVYPEGPVTCGISHFAIMVMAGAS